MSDDGGERRVVDDGSTDRVVDDGSTDGAGDSRDRTPTGEDRLRPFTGVRISKGTSRSRGWSALVRMLRGGDGEDGGGD